MVVAGKDCPDQASDDEIADATITVLRQAVPAAVPGIVFLSGGMSDEQATARLDALNKQRPRRPWTRSGASSAAVAQHLRDRRLGAEAPVAVRFLVPAASC